MVGLANRQMYPGLSGEMASWNTWVSFISASMFEKEKVLEVRFAKQNCEKVLVFRGGILALAEQYGDRRAVRVHASSRLCAWRPHRTTRACHTNTQTRTHPSPRHAAPRHMNIQNRAEKMIVKNIPSWWIHPFLLPPSRRWLREPLLGARIIGINWGSVDR